MKRLLLIALLLAAGPAWAQPTAGEAAAACSLPADTTNYVARIGCINALTGFAMGMDETLVHQPDGWYRLSIPDGMPYTEFVNQFIAAMKDAPKAIQDTSMVTVATALFIAKYGKKINPCGLGIET